MSRLILTTAAALIAIAASAGSRVADSRADILAIPARAGGICYAYPTSDIVSNRTAPDGYEPFYVSHYGRHGSRYLIADEDYTRPMEVLRKAAQAGALTPTGERLLAQLDTIWLEARGRGGELTPLGSRQHRGIARRLATDYPAVFAEGAHVTAASTPVMRCAHSMFAFIEGLKELNPDLDIPRESAKRNLYYLNYHSPESGHYSGEKGPWFQDFKRFRADRTNPDRFIGTVFADSDYVDTWVDRDEFMWQIYWIAVIMQNMETDIDLLPLFTNDELYDMYQVANYNFYACNSSYPRANGEHIRNAGNLVRDIVDNADTYIADGSHGATLRFGHDGNIIPLTALMGIDGCYSEVVRPEELTADYNVYAISPMASNLQLIFFRPTDGKGDILVRAMLNEQDATLPIPSRNGYYRWTDLRQHLVSLLQ